MSLGLRSQALKLKFVTPKTPGRFIEPTLLPEKMLATFDERFSADLPKPVFHQAHIGETLNLIYSPFYWKNGKIFDAVLNRAATAAPADDAALEQFRGGRPNWPTDFIATLCPDCGWDLNGQRDSLALLCHNCNTIWRPSARSLKKTPFAHIPGAGGNLIYLPFWRVAADISGMALTSYADLVREANLPRVVQEDWHAIDFHFWAPAFKVRPRVFFGLQRNLTLTQPQEKMVPDIPKARLYPVNLPLKEALEGLKTTLAGFLKPPHRQLPRLPDIQVKARRFLLVYMPFNEGPHEYINSEYKLAVNKKQLALSKYL